MTLQRQLLFVALLATLLLGITLAWPAAHAHEMTRARVPAAPAGVAAMVDGQPVPMALYRRELGIYRVTLPGPLQPAGTPAGSAREMAVEDRALRQAVAETIIAREAARRGLSASTAAVQAELGRMRTQAGGATALAAIAHQEGLRASDLWAMARTAVLDDLLLSRARDPHLVDRLYAHARIIVYVGPRAGLRGLAPAPEAGHPAPELAATTSDGRTVSLGGLRGTPVLLNMWSTTCTWCRAEMPLLDRFAHSHPGVRVIVLDVGDGPSAAVGYMRALGLHLTVWLDQGGSAAQSYGLNGLPDTFAIDRGGVVRAVTIGALDGEETLGRDAAAAAG